MGGIAIPAKAFGAVDGAGLVHLSVGVGQTALCGALAARRIAETLPGRRCPECWKRWKARGRAKP